MFFVSDSLVNETGQILHLSRAYTDVAWLYRWLKECSRKVDVGIKSGPIPQVRDGPEREHAQYRPTYAR